MKASPPKKHSILNTSAQDRRRLLWIALGMFGLFSLLIAQFYRIQIIEGDKWERVARRQHFFVVKEPFLRGSFYSNGSLRPHHPEKPQPFTIDIETFGLYIDPESIPEEHRNPMARQLMTLLDLAVEEQGNLREQFDKKSRSRKLALWLDRHTRDAVQEWWLPYARQHHIARNALFFVSDYRRSYPFGKLLGQVLHTVQHQKDEITKQAFPTGGLELTFNQYLQGKLGKRLLMRSPRHSFETGAIIESPQNGADVYLTINHYLQAIAEEELAKGVKKTKSKSGWAVMMDPYTGEILALAQYPFFYPPEYSYYFNDKEMLEHAKVKAITDANEPGSVMKPLTITIGLLGNLEMKKRGEQELFSPEEKIATANGRFPGRSKQLTDVHLHHFLNMYMGLQKSSNVYMARIMQRVVDNLGNEWYRQQLHDVFGFGKKVGLELPAESAGVLPAIGKKHPNGALEWSKATPFSLAMGHNIQTTSLQLVRAYAVLANGGYFVNPTLVRKVVRTNVDGQEEVLLDNTTPERKASFPQVLDPTIIKEVIKAMKYVTKPGGAARRADIPGYTEAGKSGTATKIVNGSYSKTLHCSTFIGFSPVEHPAFVLLVTLDEPEFDAIGHSHHGGGSAAPIFRDIATRSLAYLGVPPDDPYTYPGSPLYDPKKADWKKEVLLLQENYEKWNKQ